jgi:hypothetical protein
VEVLDLEAEVRPEYRAVAEHAHAGRGVVVDGGVDVPDLAGCAVIGREEVHRVQEDGDVRSPALRDVRGAGRGNGKIDRNVRGAWQAHQRDQRPKHGQLAQEDDCAEGSTRQDLADSSSTDAVWDRRQRQCGVG